MESATSDGELVFYIEALKFTHNISWQDLWGGRLESATVRFYLWEKLCQMCNKILIDNWEPKLLFHLNTAAPVDRYFCNF